MQAEPIISTSDSLLRAFDNAACWLRYTDKDLLASLTQEEIDAFENDNKEALVKCILKVTSLILDLLPAAFKAGTINGLLLNREDNEPKPVTRSYVEFSAEVDEMFCAFAMTCCESPNGLRSLVKILLASTECPDVILRVLLAIFNYEVAESEMNAELFTQACEYACNASLFDRAVYSPVSLHGLEWIDSWDISDEERAQIAFETAVMLETHKHFDDCAKWRLYGLSKSNKKESKVVAKLLAAKIKADADFLFDKVITLPAVQAVKDEEEVKVLYAICSEFYEGDLRGLNEIYRVNSTLLSEMGFEESALRFKMLVISLASVGAKTLASSPEAKQLSHEVVLDLNELATLLEASPEQIERAAAAAIAFGILQGKLNQQFNTLTVHAGLHRKFERDQWTEVLERLETWRSTLLQVEQKGITSH